MKRLLALSLLGLACTTGCSLDLGNTDQNNDGQGDDAMGDDTGQPPDLPGDEYRQCVLDTLQVCDDGELTPDDCTALIAATCNTGVPCDPWSDPMSCPPPPDDCYASVFADCVAQGGDPQDCAVAADAVCYPQCQPGDPNCEPPPCDPSTGQGCDDCWSQVFFECVDSGIPEELCLGRADEACYPPPPDDCYETVFNECVELGGDPQECANRAAESCTPQCQPGDPNCEPPPCDDPPVCDPSTGEGCDCWSLVFFECINSGLSEEECAPRADEACFPPPCTDQNDPNCEQWPGDGSATRQI
jgi:hypothetical protein